MKKARIGLLVIALLALAGCARSEPAWETVDDQMDVACVSYLDQAYTISFQVPEDAVQSAFATSETRTVYQQVSGDYEISSEVFLASGMDSAVRQLSGFNPDQLQIIQTTRFGMPEYQFAWYASGDEGGRLCRADVLLDDVYCYALSFSVNEDVGNTYDTTAAQVFATMGLYFDEQA